MIAGKDARCFGEAKNSWLTDTAAWTFVTVAEGLFGIKAESSASASCASSSVAG